MRGLGYKPDSHDPRDRLFGAMPRRLGGAPPLTASLRPHVASVLDQGATNSCVGQSIAQAVRTLLWRQQPAATQAPELLSRLFVYYAARAYHGEEHTDGGTYIRSAMRALAKLGFCPESAHRFELGEVNRMPPWAAFRRAADQRAPASYWRVDTWGVERVRDIKRAVWSGYPVIFGTTVGSDFLDWRGGAPSDPPRNPVGGHAMCAVEYDEGGLRGPNSWGRNWGEDGWFYLSWDYVEWFATRDVWVFETVQPFSG